ncbi:MAG: hypothetical protein ACLPHP_11000 [Candidatus Sulfotelmatobacter sp.]
MFEHEMSSCEFEPVGMNTLWPWSSEETATFTKLYLDEQTKLYRGLATIQLSSHPRDKPTLRPVDDRTAQFDGRIDDRIEKARGQASVTGLDPVARP